MNVYETALTQGYDVDENGIVYSTKYKHQRELKQRTAHNGYSIVDLMVSGTKKTLLVHRLVAQKFIGNSSLTVNHKNGIKTDNRISNLEYCSQSENNKHSYDTNLRSAAVKQFCKPVRCVELGLEFGSTADAARAMQCSKQCIQRACKEQHRTVKGYHWTYTKGDNNEL